jgi:hypothetical protein
MDLKAAMLLPLEQFVRHQSDCVPVFASSLLAVSCVVPLACASGPQTAEGADYGFDATSGVVWVTGPWEKIEPSKDVDEVIDQLCPAVMNLPGARGGDYGREYCGVIYKLLSENQYYASKPSPLIRPALSPVGKSKTCLAPKKVKDSRGALKREGDYHGHPWPTQMSEKDRVGANQYYLFRIQFDILCRVQKLIPHVEDTRPGELYERQGNGWKLIGYILPEDKSRGYVTPVAQ